MPAIRNNMGLTQAMFAARFGFSINTILNREGGKRKPDPPPAQWSGSAIQSRCGSKGCF